MKKKILVVLAAVMMMAAVTGCTNPVGKTISYETETTEMIFTNPQTGESYWVDLED